MAAPRFYRKKNSMPYNYTENRGIIQYIYSLYAKHNKECRCRKEENGSGMKEKNIWRSV
jgi:hypothetical protein